MASEKVKNALILTLAGAVIFLAGRHWNVLESQGTPGRRLPVTPEPPAAKAPATAAQVLPHGSSRLSSGAAGGGLIAVTGDYGVGTSVLYVIDTESRSLAVYEARGGTKGSRQLVWVGARRIDLDLQTLSYNDESEVSYEELRDLFRKKGLVPAGAGEPGPAR